MTDSDRHAGPLGTVLVDQLQQPCAWCSPCKDCERLMEDAADEIERLMAVAEAAKHLRTQSRKHTLGCSWSCRNMLELFKALEAAEKAKDDQ